MHEYSDDIFAGSGAEPIALARGDFEVRLANNRPRLKSSGLLVQRMYSGRGYKTSPNDPARADHVVLQVCRRGTVFGTLTLCFDSIHGLAADALYRSEIDQYRLARRKVCELTRLAVDPEYGSREVLGALFHMAYIHVGLVRKATDVFIEVNPRHVSFYQRMLHFNRAGECRMCERVHAPAVLLHLKVAHVAEQIARYGGRRDCASGSLYPYFLSEEEEQRFARRALAADGSRWDWPGGLLSGKEKSVVWSRAKGEGYW